MDTLLFMKWKMFFIVLTISFCLISCSENASENTLSKDIFLAPQRNDKIQQTKEWQDFNQAYNDLDNFHRETYSNLLPDYRGEEKRLEKCLEKVNSLEPLIRQGLISQSELDAMKLYLNHEFGTGRIQTQADVDDKEAMNLQEAFWQYRAYNVLKTHFGLIKNIAKQKDCLDWIKNEYLIFLQNEVWRVEKTTPKTMKYWNYCKCQVLSETGEFILRKDLKYYWGELIPPIKLEEVRSFINEVKYLLSDINKK